MTLQISKRWHGRLETEKKEREKRTGAARSKQLQQEADTQVRRIPSSTNTAFSTSVPTSSHSNPHDAHDNIHALALAPLILVTPHAIPLIVPVSPASTVHTPTPNLALDLLPTVRALLLLSVALRRARIRQVLDDGAVDGELVPALALVGFDGPRRGRGFGDQGLQDAVDYAVVPARGAVVLVACGGREGRVAG